MDKIKISVAKRTDARFIALLGRVTFAETFGHYFGDKNDLLEYCDATFSVGKIENGLAKKNNLYWIAFVNRLPVGYAKLKLNSPSEFIDIDNVCQLQKIYILKDFLSMKIGFELQNRLLERAKEIGFSQIWLSVLQDNKRAILFYQNNGFKKIGGHNFKIGNEHFEFMAMSKIL
ncbi:MAG: GNAT family N-acetyltransferase [Aurantibacter sp.]